MDGLDMAIHDLNNDYWKQDYYTVTNTKSQFCSYTYLSEVNPLSTFVFKNFNKIYFQPFKASPVQNMNEYVTLFYLNNFTLTSCSKLYDSVTKIWKKFHF